MAEVEKLQTKQVEFASRPKLFNRWEYDEVSIQDLCFKNYIAVSTPKS